LSEEKIVLTLEANDEASKKIDNISDALRNLDKQASTSGSGASGGISGIVSSFEHGVSRINSATRQYNSAMSGFNRTVINVVKEAGSAIYDFTSDSINNFTKFSEQHAKVLGAMAADYDRTAESQAKFFSDSQKLKEQAMQIGTYGISGTGSLIDITGVSQAQESLVKAGIDIDTITDTNVLKDVLTFAQGNDLDIDSATSTAVTLGNQFDVDPKDWGLMLDKISHTADMSVVEVSDIVQSLKWASGISSGLDRSLEETLGMLTILGDFGLKGSQAGTGVQALLSRILTGDTTVITDAQKEVAPGNALEKFYEFEKKAKPDGNLLPMADVVDELNATMEDMTDEEQAWFAKKLFGLYQMKSAYALMNGEDTDLNDVIKEIEEQSEGTNQNKLDQLLNSQYGQMTSLTNLWEGTKTDFGDRLNPFVNAVRDELFEFLNNDGNYDINFNNLRIALDESCDLIEEKYGSAIANGVRNIGDFTIDLTQAMSGVAPELGEGLIELINDAVEGGGLFGKDGIFGNWGEMIDNMYASAEEMPTPELEKLATAITSVVDWCGKLVAINLATNIAELISSALQIMTILGGAVIKVSGAVYVNGESGGTGNNPVDIDGDGNSTIVGGDPTTGKKGKTKTITGKTSKNGKSVLGNADEVAEALGTTADDVIKQFGDKAKYTVDDIAKGFGTTADDVIGTIGSVSDDVVKSGGLWGKLSGFGKALGIIGTIASVGSTAYDAYGKFKEGDTQGGTEEIAKGTGSLSGGYIGAAAGSFFGPIGTVVGSILGSTVLSDYFENLAILQADDWQQKMTEKYPQAYSYESNYEPYDQTPQVTKDARKKSEVKPSDYGMPSVLDKHFNPQTGEIPWESIIGQIKLGEKYPVTHKSKLDKYSGLTSSEAESWQDSQAYKDYIKAINDAKEAEKKRNAELEALMITINKGNADYDARLDPEGRGHYSVWNGTQAELDEYMEGRHFIGANDGKSKKGTIQDPYTMDELKESIKNGIIEGFNNTTNTGGFINKYAGFIGPLRHDDIIKNNLTIDNKITTRPQFTVAAPTVNVDVKVDQYGRVTKNTTILNPNQYYMFNEWFTRTQSQFGKTTK
jgi:TP901 family phage tail tape measure protein